MKRLYRCFSRRVTDDPNFPPLVLNNNGLLELSVDRRLFGSIDIAGDDGEIGCFYKRNETLDPVIEFVVPKGLVFSKAVLQGDTHSEKLVHSIYLERTRAVWLNWFTNRAIISHL
jgi:hypothetical protein